jgi:hypothetical protein
VSEDISLPVPVFYQSTFEVNVYYSRLNFGSFPRLCGERVYHHELRKRGSYEKKSNAAPPLWFPKT